MSNKGPIRRSQLIAPFGVGAMVVLRDGVSVIACGLDHWYEREGASNTFIDYDEFIIHEWRLERSLNVSGFRLPPDYRRPKYSGASTNTDLKIPFLRFPLWHFCPGCQLLTDQIVSSNSAQRFFRCPDCEKDKKIKSLVQVPFIAICEKGHIQDFPWREWVHGKVDANCFKKMKLKGNGDAGLAGQIVECDCGKTRNLSAITESSSDGSTILTSNLDSTKPYLCSGSRPWHGDNCHESCGLPIKGSLRSASNVYYAETRSAIYIPRAQPETVNEICEILGKPPYVSLISMAQELGGQVSVERLRKTNAEGLHDYSDGDIELALKIRTGQINLENLNEIVEGDLPETAFRRAEFNVLRSDRDESNLKVQQVDCAKYRGDFAKWFSNVTLVNKLKETRVLIGFSRIRNEIPRTTQDLIGLLWKSPPEKNNIWLPAYEVFGEGIFFELNHERLAKWENSPNVIARLRKLISNNEEFRKKRGLAAKDLSPRFVLLHTLAHLLINRITFECGYSTASLKERIYESTNPVKPMAGILIYTAAGDSEGTMGGLVRMGKPGYLENLIAKVIDEAKWCSADPVCMEIADSIGQGPDSCNLAACHNCALIPETACDHFNKYLDRGALIGSLEDEEIGYFC